MMKRQTLCNSSTTRHSFGKTHHSQDMKRQERSIRLHTDAGTHYVWLGGSCDYAHKERAGGGAYVIEKDGKTIGTFATSACGTTEFRMMLTAMVHAMNALEAGSTIVFLTNVAYLTNFDKPSADGSPNADLIRECAAAKARHKTVKVKVLPYHKFSQLQAMHELAHNAMTEARKQDSSANGKP